MVINDRLLNLSKRVAAFDILMEISNKQATTLYKRKEFQISINKLESVFYYKDSSLISNTKTFFNYKKYLNFNTLTGYKINFFIFIAIFAFLIDMGY